MYANKLSELILKEGPYKLSWNSDSFSLQISGPGLDNIDACPLSVYAENYFDKCQTAVNNLNTAFSEGLKHQSQELALDNKTSCPSCGGEPITTNMLNKKIEYLGDTIHIVVPVRICNNDACGFEYEDSEAARIRDRAIQQHVRNKTR